jgi:hypothetical protein
MNNPEKHWVHKTQNEDKHVACLSSLLFGGVRVLVVYCLVGSVS